MKLPRPLALLLRSRLLGVLFIAFLFGLWEWSARSGAIDSPSWVPVSEVFDTWWGELLHGDLLSELWVSLMRMFRGYAIAAAVGIIVGVAMGYVDAVFKLLEPLVELLRPIPSPAYIPVVILFVGIGDEMKVVIIATGCLFPILVNAYTGVKNVDRVQIDTGRTFGLRAPSILGRIVFPAASPYILAGLRISLAIGLILAVISEMIAANNGIGYYILNAQRVFKVREMYAGILTLAVVGYLLNLCFLQVERRLLAWDRDEG